MTAHWFRGPRQLRLIFLATMLLLAGTLGWLGWRLLQQDQQLSSQQMAERQETSADLAVTSMERELAAIDQDVARVLTTSELLKSESEGLFVEFGRGAIRIHRGSHR